MMKMEDLPQPESFQGSTPAKQQKTLPHLLKILLLKKSCWRIASKLNYLPLKNLRKTLNLLNWQHRKTLLQPKYLQNLSDI